MGTGGSNPPLSASFRPPPATPVTRQAAAPTPVPILVALLATLAASSAGCSGPSLSLAGDGRRYVDGRAEPRAVLPFRYYGKTAVTVVPSDDADGQPDWQRVPAHGEIEIAAPASPWLFPLDLLIELAAAAGGRPDQAATVTTGVAPAPVIEGFPPGGLEELRRRALAARVWR